MQRRGFDEFDLIRLNLQRMDALTSDTPLIDRIFSSAPVLPFAVAFSLGILLAYKVQTPRIVWMMIFCVTLSAGSCLLFTLKTKTGLRFALALSGALLATFALGIVRSYSITDRPPNHISGYLQNERKLATLKGKVISSVRTDAFSRGLSAIPWLSSQSSFYIQTEQIRSP
ncbi:MAG: hypothetical protein ACYSO7_10270, partial [Planctomycetota bacterium]